MVLDWRAKPRVLRPQPHLRQPRLTLQLSSAPGKRAWPMPARKATCRSSAHAAHVPRDAYGSYAKLLEPGTPTSHPLQPRAHRHGHATAAHRVRSASGDGRGPLPRGHGPLRSASLRRRADAPGYLALCPGELGADGADVRERLGFDPPLAALYAPPARVLRRISHRMATSAGELPMGDTHPDRSRGRRPSSCRSTRPSPRLLTEELAGFGGRLQPQRRHARETISLQGRPSSANTTATSSPSTTAPRPPLAVDHTAPTPPAPPGAHAQPPRLLHEGPALRQHGRLRAADRLRDLAVRPNANRPGRVVAPPLVEKLPPVVAPRNYPQHALATPLVYRARSSSVKCAPRDFLIIRDQYWEPQPCAQPTASTSQATSVRRRGARSTSQPHSLLRIPFFAREFEFEPFPWSHTNGGGSSTRARARLDAATGQFVTVSTRQGPAIEALPTACAWRDRRPLDAHAARPDCARRCARVVVSRPAGRSSSCPRARWTSPRQGQIGLFVPNAGYSVRPDPRTAHRRRAPLVGRCAGTRAASIRRRPPRGGGKERDGTGSHSNRRHPLNMVKGTDHVPTAFQTKRSTARPVFGSTSRRQAVLFFSSLHRVYLFLAAKSRRSMTEFQGSEHLLVPAMILIHSKLWLFRVQTLYTADSFRRPPTCCWKKRCAACRPPCQALAQVIHAGKGQDSLSVFLPFHDAGIPAGRRLEEVHNLVNSVGGNWQMTAESMNMRMFWKNFRSCTFWVKRSSAGFGSRKPNGLIAVNIGPGADVPVSWTLKQWIGAVRIDLVATGRRTPLARGSWHRDVDALTSMRIP